MMPRPPQQRRRWTNEEDQKLFECKSNNGHLSWPAIAMLAELDRSGKSCRERWNNYLRRYVNRGTFSLEEDNVIINYQSVYGNRWATIATHLPGRTDNDIKNRWNNHLKKGLARSTHQNIPNPPSSTGDQPDATRVLHLNQNIPNPISIPTPVSASQEIFNRWSPSATYLEFLRRDLPWDDEIHHSFGGDDLDLDLESLIVGPDSLIPNVYPNSNCLS